MTRGRGDGGGGGGRAVAVARAEPGGGMSTGGTVVTVVVTGALLTLALVLTGIDPEAAAWGIPWVGGPVSGVLLASMQPWPNG